MGCVSEDLAREIECSPRTIFRDVEILSAAGIPITYDKFVQAYRVRDGFRFSGLDPKRVEASSAADPAIHDLLVNARRMLKDAEAFLDALRQLCGQLEGTRQSGT